MKPKDYPLTLFFVALCSFMLFLTTITSPEFTLEGSHEQISPVYTSPIKEYLLFDFPKAFEILKELIDRFGVDILLGKTEMPKTALPLVNAFEATPYWQGYYDTLLNLFEGHGNTQSNVYWFEKIKQGEVWRFVTPIFLHGDLLHLLFNMLWLYVLGRQIEFQIGKTRYLLFIFVAAIFTNTLQYLMGGANFVGFSGVLTAMLTFIWMRQTLAPWEKYDLQRSTFLFFMVFIFGMFFIQTTAFGLEIFTGYTLPTFIANTAHIAGAAFGLLLARISFFTPYKETV